MKLHLLIKLISVENLLLGLHWSACGCKLEEVLVRQTLRLWLRLPSLCSHSSSLPTVSNRWNTATTSFPAVAMIGSTGRYAVVLHFFFFANYFIYPDFSAIYISFIDRL